jgi:hypothetical protein
MHWIAGMMDLMNPAPVMPNHPSGFAPDTYLCVSCHYHDGQTMVGENVAHGACLSAAFMSFGRPRLPQN